MLDSHDDGVVGRLGSSVLKFAPVGNSPCSPVVIVCGKTPGADTHTRFLAECRRGRTIDVAARSTVYSRMRKKLYEGLRKINLFKFLMTVVPEYWDSGDSYELWNHLFSGMNVDHCGIQLTQACNCAVVNCSGKGGPSRQPSKATVRRLNEMNPECLFSSFRVTPRLRLVVFLDTPSSDAQFHQEHFFAGSQVGKRCTEQGVTLISIPHPSDANPIYNDLDTLDDLRDKDSRHGNAYLLFKRGAQAVAGLTKRNVIQE
ncbi:MAG: hypothetical protein ACM3WU_08440 [Bacillota bacterium]